MIYKVIEPDGETWNIVLDFPDIFDIFTCKKGKYIITGTDIDEAGNNILYAESVESVDINNYLSPDDVFGY